MDIVRLYEDYGIDYVIENHKHARKNWVQTTCPFCTGNSGYHLGFNLSSNTYNCWRCGYHSMGEALRALLPTGESIWYVVSRYSHDPIYHIPIVRERRALNFQVPGSDLRKIHLDYLESRGFSSPQKLAQKYSLKGTGFNEYPKLRIVIPITHRQEIVTYQSRDITNTHQCKYLACAAAQSIIDIKHTVYNLNNCTGDTILITEGVMDVWKLGDNACCTYGTKTTHEQISLLKQYKNRLILFDSDSAGQQAATKLANELALFPGNTEIIRFKGAKDIGELPEQKAQEIKQALLFCA